MKKFKTFIFLAGLYALCGSIAFALVTYEPNQPIVIGEFLFDDDYVATTTDCVVSIYSPNGITIASNALMSTSSNGWHYYNYSGSSTVGVWPAVMSCGTAGIDLVKMDKSFAIAPSAQVIADAVWNNETRDLTDYATATIAAGVWSSSDRSLTSYGSLVTDIWSSTSRSLTTFGTLIADIWNSGTRTLTGAGLSSGSLATADDVTNASSSLAAQISNIWSAPTRTLTASDFALATSTLNTISSSVWTNATRTLTYYGNDITSADVWGYIGSVIHSGSSGSWTVSMSDAQQILAGNSYRLKVYTTNNAQPQNSLSAPSVTIYDVNRNVVVSNVPATNIGTGIYEYVYAVPTLAAQGVWETVIDTNVQSAQNVVTSDYWEVRGAPAQVIVRAVNGVTVPNISADVTITNEGSGGYEYLYEWCVVSAQNNSCGGGDDISYGSAAKFIQSGEDWNTVLTAHVPTPGNYYFKVVAYFGTESSGASRSFTAISPVTIPPSNGGAGGGGGGGSPSNNTVPSQTPPKSSCVGADFNHDGKVNPIDFSILLYFWKTNPPFSNPCSDINSDSRVDTVDFSILLYQWGTSGTVFKKQ